MASIAIRRDDDDDSDDDEDIGRRGRYRPIAPSQRKTSHRTDTMTVDRRTMDPLVIVVVIDIAES